MHVSKVTGHRVKFVDGKPVSSEPITEPIQALLDVGYRVAYRDDRSTVYVHPRLAGEDQVLVEDLVIEAALLGGQHVVLPDDVTRAQVVEVAAP